MAELHIPEAAETALALGNGRHAIRLTLAAELRRLAKLHDAPHVDHELGTATSIAFSVMHEIAQDLRSRADEIEREGQ